MPGSQAAQASRACIGRGNQDQLARAGWQAGGYEGMGLLFINTSRE